MAGNVKYEFRNGVLVVVDADGNVSSGNTSQSTSVTEQPEQSWQESNPSPVPAAYKQEWIPIEESTPVEPSTPTKKLNKEELAKRDREAVAYSKALLLDGDTLVYITYPGESKCFDSTGFEISASPHRVHSSRLLATGSSVFAKLLSPTNQFRTIRRKNLVGHLPPGIHYVLDLTPPDEGDAAVELTAELSCSLGVRHWYRSEQLSNVPRRLVGGEDEFLSAQNITSFGSSVDTKAEDDQEATSDGPNNDCNESTELPQENVAWVAKTGVDFEKDIAKAKELSMTTMPKVRVGQIKQLNVPEYCPVRHRAGIARLLQVLEGKDPRLDSAPKVWTLFVLAKFFDCTNVVVDWIVTWILADANTRFIEILPEASCKMAFGLKNQLICRAAFSILVSEEAMSLASREKLKFHADTKGTNQFGRIREDIDEDLRTRIEYASKNFASRVGATFDALVDAKMTWFLNLPEYQKLREFEDEILLATGGDERGKKWISVISELAVGLRLYIHGRLLDTLSAPLSHDEIINGNEHRTAEQYTSTAPNVSFQNQYRNLGDRERIFTRSFWKMIPLIDLPSWYGQHKEEEWRARKVFGDEVRPTYSMLSACQREANIAIIEAIQGSYFHNGVMPKEAFKNPETNRAYLPEESHQGNAAPRSASFSTTDWNPFAVTPSTTTETQTPNKGVNDENSSTGGISEVPNLNVSTGMTAQPVPALLRTDAMIIDEFIAQQLLRDAAAGSRSSFDSNETGQISMNSNSTDLPFRPLLPKATYSPAQTDSKPLYPTDHLPVPQAKAESQTEPDWWFKESTGESPEIKTTNLQRLLVNIPKIGSTKFNRFQQLMNRKIGQLSAKDEIFPLRYGAQVKFGDPVKYGDPVTYSEKPSPWIPHDYDIREESPFFNMTRFFQEAKEHVRRVANRMLDTPDIGFDVVVTDTLLCLSQEEFKYLPLWAGGDDDDSGGVFDDAIPVALAGPNGPGPAFHTGFSAASAASSEFDTMSDRTAFNTSVGVEDGYSDHIDRREVVADDDFHSETFSEDSEVYDRKGKGVARDGFYTSAPSSVAALSVSETVSEAAPEENPDTYMVEDEEEDDNDTTVGQGDQEDLDVWDEGDTESFDFGDDDSDEEMVSV